MHNALADILNGMHIPHRECSFRTVTVKRLNNGLAFASDQEGTEYVLPPDLMYSVGFDPAVSPGGPTLVPNTGASAKVGDTVVALIQIDGDGNPVVSFDNVTLWFLQEPAEQAAQLFHDQPLIRVFDDRDTVVWIGEEYAVPAELLGSTSERLVRGIWRLDEKVPAVPKDIVFRGSGRVSVGHALEIAGLFATR